MVRQHQLPISSICSVRVVMLLNRLTVCADTEMHASALAEHFGLSYSMQVVTFFSHDA